MDEKDKLLLHTGNFAMQSALGFYSNSRFDQDDCYVEYFPIPESVLTPNKSEGKQVSRHESKKPPGGGKDA